MSWDADLYAITETTQCGECGHALDPPKRGEEWAESWNYTHNTNGMIAAAYEAVSGEATEQASGPLGPVIGAAWWKRLDGARGEGGLEYLRQVIAGLEADPDRYRAMNPENGWGDYDRLLDVLRRMRDATAELGQRALWRVSG